MAATESSASVDPTSDRRAPASCWRFFRLLRPRLPRLRLLRPRPPRPRLRLRTFLLLCPLVALLAAGPVKRVYDAWCNPISCLGPVCVEPYSPTPSDDDIRRTVGRGQESGFVSLGGIPSYIAIPVTSRVDDARVVPLIGPCALQHERHAVLLFGSRGGWPWLDICFLHYNYFRMPEALPASSDP